MRTTNERQDTSGCVSPGRDGRKPAPCRSLVVQDLAQGHRTLDKIRSERERIGLRVLELRKQGLESQFIARRLGVTQWFANAAAREVELCKSTQVSDILKASKIDR